jgi:hypothetical protein
MRYSNDVYAGGRLIDGYDYANQAWVVDGKYVRCGHPESMACGCYGRVHAGEETKLPALAGHELCCGECLMNHVKVVHLVNGVCPNCG